MNEFYITLFIGLIIIIMELATTSFYLLIIGLAIILSGTIHFFLNWLTSICISSIFGVISIILLNIYKNKHNNKHNTLLISHIGQEVIVIEIKDNNHFQVNYSGTIWSGIVKHVKNEIKIGDRLIISSFSHEKLELIQR